MSTDFYKDFLYKKDQIEVLTKAYSGVFKIFSSIITENDNNNIVTSMETYKRIPFQRIDVTGAMYSLESILNNATLMSGIGIKPSMSMLEKKEIWQTVSTQERAQLIDKAGYSIYFTSYQKISDAISEKSNYDIIDFEVLDMYNNYLVRNVDYVFYDNKLILLKEFSLDDSYKKKFLILKNIVIDTGLIEDKLGNPLNAPFSEDFTRTDYSETLKAFIGAAAGGPKINNLTKALNKYSILDGLKVIDRKNAVDEKVFWDNPQYGLSPFDFLILLPAEFLYKAEKLQYIKSFFSQIKPAYSSYVFLPTITSTYDKLYLKSAPFTFAMETYTSFKDIIKIREAIDLTKGTILSAKDIMHKDDSASQAGTASLSDDLSVHTDDSVSLLNSTVKNDKINEKREVAEYSSELEKIDLLPFTKVQNIYVCDRSINCDDTSSLLLLDNEGDSEGYIRDFIGIELIKN